MDFLANLERRVRIFWTAAGFVLIAGIGIVDFLTGYEFAFSFFYLIPVSAITWIAGRRVGIAASLAGAMVWLAVDVAAGNSYSHPFIYVWNTIIVLGSFVTVTILLSALKRALEREREAGRTDYLTGAVNSRFFYELVRMEISRSQRYKHPFTVAYIDIDNFKAVNDRFGHATGDHVLRAVVHQARKHLRKTDVVARLGGDEFALLLPETSQVSAQAALSKIRRHIFEGMPRHNLSITGSVGVLTCLSAPHTADEIIGMADNLMYEVKGDGKNAIKYRLYTG